MANRPSQEAANTIGGKGGNDPGQATSSRHTTIDVAMCSMHNYTTLVYIFKSFDNFL